MTIKGLRSLRSVVLFYTITCAWSWPFMIWMVFYPDSWQNLSLPGFLKTTLFMWGPGIAALVTSRVFKRSGIALLGVWGDQFLRSVLFYVVPLIAVAIVYYNEVPVGSLLMFVLLFGTIGFLNTLGEELGWRGFLQQALNRYPLILRFIVVGVMWEFWHIFVRLSNVDFVFLAFVEQQAVWLVASVVISIILGYAVDRTKAVATAVTLHFWLNGIREIPQLLNVDSLKLYMVLGLSILFWLYMILGWDSGSSSRMVKAER